MVMDYLRTSYRRKAKIFRDSDQLVTLSWYPAPPGAKIFPGHHLFASGDWCDKNYDWPGLGEQLLPRRHWSSGTNLRPYRGQCFVGEREWYDFGVPLSAVPVGDFPACCMGPIPIGGLSLNGAAVVTSGNMVIHPSISWNGRAPNFYHIAFYPRGGVSLGGTARHVHKGLQSGVGGVSFRAPAPFHHGLVRPFSGGVALDGHTRTSRVGEQSGFGGVSFGGSARLTVVLSMRPTGGVSFGGRAHLFQGRIGRLTGGLVWDGLATTSTTGEQSGQGGVSFAGHARSARVGEQSEFGAVSFGGTAAVDVGTLTPACPNPLPSTFQATFTSKTGAFAPFPTDFTFTQESGFQWVARFPSLYDGTITFSLNLNVSGPSLIGFNCFCAGIVNLPPLTAQCHPFLLHFQAAPIQFSLHCGMPQIPSNMELTITG